MARFDPENVPPGKRAWDPDNPGVGYYRRKDGKGGAWLIRPWQTFPDGSRRQVTETLKTCPNRQQAVGLLRKRQAQDFEGTFTARRSVPTVNDFKEAFLYAKRELATVEKYRRQLDGHVGKFFGDISLAMITTADCEEYRRRRLAARAAPATIRSELRCLQSLFTEARKAEVCDRDPVRDVAFGRIDNERTRVVLADERKRLFEEAHKRTDYVRALFFTLWFTGMRISHAARLRWDDVDEAERTGFIRTTPDKDGNEVTIPLVEKLRDELRFWRKLAPTSQWVFPARNDKKEHRTRHGVAGAWTAFLAAARVRDVTAHDLRRTLITELAASGATEKQIQAITGQRSSSMVRRYEQPAPDTLRDRMDAVISG